MELLRRRLLQPPWPAGRSLLECSAGTGASRARRKARSLRPLGVSGQAAGGCSGARPLLWRVPPGTSPRAPSPALLRSGPPLLWRWPAGAPATGTAAGKRSGGDPPRPSPSGRAWRLGWPEDSPAAPRPQRDPPSRPGPAEDGGGAELRLPPAGRPRRSPTSVTPCWVLVVDDGV